MADVGSRSNLAAAILPANVFTKWLFVIFTSTSHVGPALPRPRLQVKANKPFFCWFNATRMHFRTHVKADNRGKSGQDEYGDGMVEHDVHVGLLLKKVDDLGIANDTIVFYSTDNGPHYNAWPDAGTTPFRSEKNSNWEGAYRVPAFIRWPGKFMAGKTVNGLVAHEDWLVTFLTAAGMPDVKERLMKGDTFAGREVPFSSRRLQHARLSQWQGQGLAAQRVLVRQRRWRCRRRPLAGLEGRVPGKPWRGFRCLARAVC
jgi:arylsulfatase A-like enzyme